MQIVGSQTLPMAGLCPQSSPLRSPKNAATA